MYKYSISKQEDKNKIMGEKDKMKNENFERKPSS
jgi:hypothetical protein